MCLTSAISLAGIRGYQDSIAEPLSAERGALLENVFAFSDFWLWVLSLEGLGEKKVAGDSLARHLKEGKSLWKT